MRTHRVLLLNIFRTFRRRKTASPIRSIRPGLRSHIPLLTTLGAVAISLAATNRSDACFMRSPQPVQVWMDHVHVDIIDQVAIKTYDCVFKNLNITLKTIVRFFLIIFKHGNYRFP